VDLQSDHSGYMILLGAAANKIMLPVWPVR